MEENGNEVAVIPLPNLPLFIGANVVDVNGNVIPEAQIIRRQVEQPSCSQQSKAKLTVLFCIIEAILSVLFAWIYLTVSDGSAPRTFSWKHLNDFFYIPITNGTDGCRKLQKSVPVHRDSRIRPFLNPNDFCVTDKTLTICPYETTADWLSIPLVPLLTFFLPIVLIILTAIRVFGNSRERNESVGKMLCPMYLICIFNPLLFLFGWVKQFLQLAVGDGIRAEMLFGYDLMLSPDNVSPQWEQTQKHSECCGFRSYLDWNVTEPNGLYPLTCCDTRAYQCTSPPSKSQVWKKGCYSEERITFTFLTGMTILLLLIKTITETLFFFLLIDNRPAELSETSVIQCREFNARAFGAMEITDVVTDNRIMVTVRNFRPRIHNPIVERSYRYVELGVRSRGAVLGTVHVMPTNGLTLDDIIIHQDQSHRGIFEITTVTPENPVTE